jgi:TetR/AcrR family tetracycline transcriptional repressor
MAEQLMADTHRRVSLSPRPGELWWEWLERRTVAMYETLVSHRDAPRVVAGNRPTVAALPAIESALATLVDAGFEPAEAVEVIVMLGAFATGCALETQAEAERGPQHHDSELGPAIRSGEYPTILRAFADRHRRGDHISPHADMFDKGLDMIIAGLRASVADAPPAAVDPDHATSTTDAFLDALQHVEILDPARDR